MQSPVNGFLNLDFTNFLKLSLGILVFSLSACVNQPIIETKRSYDDDKAMQYYLDEKRTIEPELKSSLKMCPSQSGSIKLRWHLNRQGKATEVNLTDDSLNCPELNTLLKKHLSTLSFPKPQPLDRVELEYIFNWTSRD